MRIALISGAGSGIGRDFARALADGNLDEIWAIGRRADRLLSLERELCGRVTVRPLALDLTEREGIAALSDALLEKRPQIAYAVAAAGCGLIGPFSENDLTYLHTMTALNCTALTDMLAALLPYMERGGRIITLASASAYLPQPYFAAYAATKAYVLHLSRALAQELKPREITVTAVCPGPVRTEFFETAALHGAPMSQRKERYMTESRVVVRRALKAAHRGRTVCTPTFSMKAARLAAKLLPHALLVRIFRAPKK